MQTQIEEKRIGNVGMEWSLSLAIRFGFNTYLGGRYTWSDFRASGREEIDNPPPTFQGQKEYEGILLPKYCWYDPSQDILGVLVFEDYGQGQCSAMYFCR